MCIRIWWAHRERWNASASGVAAQCKQPAHVCAWLPSRKLLSISQRCLFFLIQTFVPPATTDAIPPQDFIHKQSSDVPQAAALSAPSPAVWSILKKTPWVLSHTHSHQKINPPFKHQRINDLNLNVPYIYRQYVVWRQAYLPFFLVVCIEKDCVCVTCAAEGGSREPFQEFCTWVSH